MRCIRAVVQATEVSVENERLVVRLRVEADNHPCREAYLPDREVSALLPRSLLVSGGLREAPPELLATIAAILERLVRGRTVRIWRYRDRSYAAFLSWRSVRFQGRPQPACSSD